jgi:hypothetical protein
MFATGLAIFVVVFVLTNFTNIPNKEYGSESLGAALLIGILLMLASVVVLVWEYLP